MKVATPSKGGRPREQTRNALRLLAHLSPTPTEHRALRRDLALSYWAFYRALREAKKIVRTLGHEIEVTREMRYSTMTEEKAGGPVWIYTYTCSASFGRMIDKLSFGEWE